MIQQRPLRLGGAAVALPEHEVLVGDPQTTVAQLEAERGERSRSRRWVGNAQNDVIEVDDLGRGFLQQSERDACRSAHRDQPVRVPLGLGRRSRKSGHPEHDALDDSGLARPVGVEQCQLAALRVASHQGERLGPLDLVHAAGVVEEGGQLVARIDPQRHVVQCSRLHDQLPVPGEPRRESRLGQKAHG